MLSNITRLTCDPITQLDFSSVQVSDDLVVFFLQMYRENNAYREFPLTLLLSLGRCTRRLFKFVPAVERTDCLARKMPLMCGKNPDSCWNNLNAHVDQKGTRKYCLSEVYT